MNPEAQRIAIAASVGIHLHDGDHAPSGYMFVDDLPDYFNDLNAMHEAESVLTFNQYHIMFIGLLQSITQRDWINGDKTAKQSAVHATAGQRAEAYLKTIGKWEVTGE